MMLIARIFLFLWIALLPVPTLLCQDHQGRWNTFDVQHYCFEIDLNDSTDVIRGLARVEIRFRQDVDRFWLDLDGPQQGGSGMTVEWVRENGNPVGFSQGGDRLLIEGSLATGGRAFKSDSTKEFLIRYRGIPRDGLIISRNKYGDRTFFGDNWPDRARCWLPVLDHPFDKATLEFIVHAPDHYRVIANGLLISESIEGGRIISHWKTLVPLPTKVMVIGVSPFAVEDLESESGIPVSSWVYPQNREAGFKDYRVALGPLAFFESYIAPYPYAKLANVQSRTRFGGMENASCIFYSERSVTGRGDQESLFAHEIAHQWFGDGVSEMDWHHVWISEGFATYLADLFLEYKYGRKVMVASLLEEKAKVINLSRKVSAPIVDTTLPVSVKLLNANSYDKAAWTLHMLRRELGDSLFRCCVQEFYREYEFSNAVTADFQHVADSLSGRDLSKFFRQWFFTPEHPVISSEWEYAGGEIRLRIQQHQDGKPFSFPLDIRVDLEDGNRLRKTLEVSSGEELFTFSSPAPPVRLVLDPDSWLLFEAY